MEYIYHAELYFYSLFNSILIDITTSLPRMGEILEQLSLLPGVELQTLHESVPNDDDWYWCDIADRVLP